MKLGPGVENPPVGASFLWGLPQMPEFLEYPYCKVPGYEAYPFFFVGQINCAEAALFDEAGLLPQIGFLWFFADLDYYWVIPRKPSGNQGDGTGRRCR